MKIILTYGTFDLFHIGHLKLLQRARSLGDKLIVGVSSDEFNQLKGKRSFLPYAHRSEIVEALECVDMVIPEDNWEQKELDIEKHNVDVFCMGGDWEGKFDSFREQCEVVYFDRTPEIDSTSLRSMARVFDKTAIDQLSDAHLIIEDLLDKIKGS